jgi:hypothetical protein
VEVGQRKKWTFETCTKAARLFTKKTDFKIAHKHAYETVLKNKWADPIFSHMIPAYRTWSRDACIEDAKMFKSRMEWKRNSGVAYKFACDHNFLNEACAHMRRPLKWTKDKCMADAASCTSRSQWYNKSQSAYESALRQGFLKECLELIPLSKHAPYTLEDITIDAKKYTTKASWKKASPSLYKLAREKGILATVCAHMVSLRVPAWTRRTVLIDAKRFKHISQWALLSNSAYNFARRNGLGKKATRHMHKPTTGAKRIICWFICRETKMAYVGLTDNIERRGRENLRDKVHLRARLEAGTLEFHIHGDPINEVEAQFLEAEMMVYWADRGFKLLNKTKAGSLGGNIHKWDKQACLADALKFSTVSEWDRASGGAVGAARRYGFFKECVAHMQKKERQWSFDECLAEASRCYSRRDWRTYKYKSFTAAAKNGWVDHCAKAFQLRPPRTKKPKQISHRPTRRKLSRWSYEACLADALRFETIKDWRLASPTAYLRCSTHGWTAVLTAHMRNVRVIWTPENCKAEASKYKTRFEFQKCSRGAYGAAYKLGILNECCEHMSKNAKLIWTKEECFKSALKCKSRAEWKERFVGAYRHSLRKKGWMAIMTAHMGLPRSNPRRNR